MKEGKTLDEAKVKTALEKNRMGFVSLETVERPIPKVAYVMQASGTT